MSTMLIRYKSGHDLVIKRPNPGDMVFDRDRTTVYTITIIEYAI